MPDNNFVTENNMKNIITALPALVIADPNSGNSLPDSVETTPSKVLTPHCNLIYVLVMGFCFFIAHFRKGYHRV
jgi:hypothetical protein